jgi:hypothetical protein
LPGARNTTTWLTVVRRTGVPADRRVALFRLGLFVTWASVVIADGSNAAIAAIERMKTALQMATIRFGCSAACRASRSVMAPR